MLDTGVDAVSVITPYFNGATQAELVEHYRAIAAATCLPVMLYTIPAKAGVTLTIDSVRRLAEVPNIRGIKDSGGDFDRLLQLINLRRDDFAVFTGTDSMILWTLIAGGDGAVAATTNAVPGVVMSIWNRFRPATSPPRARPGIAARAARRLRPRHHAGGAEDRRRDARHARRPRPRPGPTARRQDPRAPAEALSVYRTAAAR